MTEQDIQIQTLYEALKAAAYYIERLEMAQQRRKVRDMTEAMEDYHRTGPPLIAAYERS
jgi:hypothetical protein